VICLFVRRQEEWPRRLCQWQREDKLLYGILSVVCVLVCSRSDLIDSNLTSLFV
jgi:hypothetical protein